jgi:uncharacterized protein YqeY
LVHSEILEHFWYTFSVMAIKQRIDADLKAAMLGGDKTLANMLRGLKSAILYVEVAKGSRESGLSDAETIEVLSKEAKKRQESIDLYKQGGNEERAAAELAEKQAIEQYLPPQLSEEELAGIIDRAIQDTGAQGMQAMGQVIGAVKQQTAGQADGATIARLVKERLQP